MAIHKTFNVLADINLAYTTKHDMLSGIMSYVKTHTSWNLHLLAGRYDDQKRFDTRAFDGILISSRRPKWLREIDFCRIPTAIVAEDFVPDFPCCHIYCDNAPIAATAAKHLLSKHCNAYAFVHSAGQCWSDVRGKLFAKAVADGNGVFAWRSSDQKALPRLLASAPKPLGVFAATDILARATLDACRVARCNVPDDVLILGVDNDKMLCEICNPSLSSIQLSSREAGYRVAEVIDRAMRGEIAPSEMPAVPYTCASVVERLSTARSFAYDMLVRRCRETLESEFTAPIRVADLATRFRVSRRTLETHFRTVTGTTIAEEVCRLRIERAKHLLATTGNSQEEIATACGFYNASHLSATFHSRLGMRPSAFRSKAQA